MMDPIMGNASATLQVHVAPVTAAAAYIGVAENLATGLQPLMASPGTAWPLTFLSGQILESSLKAYLAARGVQEEELRKSQLRHNLIELWSRALSTGFVFNP